MPPQKVIRPKIMAYVRDKSLGASFISPKSFEIRGQD